MGPWAYKVSSGGIEGPRRRCFVALDTSDFVALKCQIRDLRPQSLLPRPFPGVHACGGGTVHGTDGGTRDVSLPGRSEDVVEREDA